MLSPKRMPCGFSTAIDSMVDPRKPITSPEYLSAAGAGDFAGLANRTERAFGLNQVADDLQNSPSPTQRGRRDPGDRSRGQAGVRSSLDHGSLRQQVEEALLDFFHLRLDAEVCRSQFGFQNAIRGAEIERPRRFRWSSHSADWPGRRATCLLPPGGTRTVTLEPSCSLSMATRTSAATSMGSTWASRCRILAAMASASWTTSDFNAREVVLPFRLKELDRLADFCRFCADLASYSLRKRTSVSLAACTRAACRRSFTSCVREDLGIRAGF